MSIIAQSPSHRGEIAEMQLRFARSCYAPYALATTSLRSTRFEATVLSALLSRFRYALGVLANRRPGSSALLKLVELFRTLRPTLFESRQT